MWISTYSTYDIFGALNLNLSCCERLINVFVDFTPFYVSNIFNVLYCTKLCCTLIFLLFKTGLKIRFWYPLRRRIIRWRRFHFRRLQFVKKTMIRTKCNSSRKYWITSNIRAMMTMSKYGRNQAKSLPSDNNCRECENVCNLQTFCI